MWTYTHPKNVLPSEFSLYDFIILKKKITEIEAYGPQ